MFIVCIFFYVRTTRSAECRAGIISFRQIPQGATERTAEGNVCRPGLEIGCPDRFAKQPRGIPVAACEIGLAAESEAGDDLLVFLLGALLDVIKEFAALGNQGEKATT